MLWEEEKSGRKRLQASGIADISFRINCRALPLDHAHALSRAVLEHLPWLASEPGAGLHLIHGAQSGNGWMRPEDVANELLHLSRRTRMALRIPLDREQDAGALTGVTLDIDGHSLEIGEAAIKPLTTLGTLFARYIAIEEGVEEEDFLEDVIAQIRALDINLQKILCGKSHVFATPAGPLHTRTVMVAGLKQAEALRLQEAGIGPGRSMGCGLFIPHKGIEAVKKLDDER